MELVWFVNKITTSCEICKEPVREGNGWSTRKQEGNRTVWVSRCSPCSGLVNPLPAVSVRMNTTGSEVVFRPTSHLGSDLFNMYRTCVHGSRYDSNSRANKAPLVLANDIILRLIKDGFDCDIHADVEKAINTTHGALAETVATATSRADEVDAALKARGMSLYGYQRTGIRWLANRKTALLADPMGLGKCVQTLTALRDNAAVLVVGPKVAKGVWEREAQKWRPDLKITILDGQGSFRFPNPGELVAINYDVLPKDAVTAPQHSVTLVVDECHMVKNSKAQRTVRLRALADQVRGNDGNVYLLTGTPLMNRPQELWNILQIAGLGTEAFGSWTRFVAAFNGHAGRYGGYIWGKPTPEAAKLLKTVMLRREKDSVLSDLPEKTIRVVPVTLDETANKKLKEILGDLSPEELDKAIRAAMSNTQNVPGFEEISQARAFLAMAKVAVLLQMIENFEEQEEPVVVFSAHRAPIDALEHRTGWATITGDTSAERRTYIENEFQAGRLLGVACTIQAGGVAITLTHAACSIFVDRAWTPGVNAQAEDRIHRIGQKRGTNIDLLVADHALDRRIAELLDMKSQIVNAAIVAAAVDGSVDIEERALPNFNRVRSACEENKRATEKRKLAAKLVQLERLRAALDRMDEELEVEKQEKKKRKEAEKEARVSILRERARQQGYIVAQNDPGRHGPVTPEETWAAQAIQQLAADDPDGAQEQNSVGFNKADVWPGHWLSRELAFGLTTNQWRLAIALCRKYHRQVGQCP